MKPAEGYKFEANKVTIWDADNDDDMYVVYLDKVKFVALKGGTVTISMGDCTISFSPQKPQDFIDKLP